MDKENGVYSHNGLYILFILKNGNPATCDNINDLEDIMLVEVSQSQKNEHCMIPLI